MMLLCSVIMKSNYPNALHSNHTQCPACSRSWSEEGEMGEPFVLKDKHVLMRISSKISLLNYLTKEAWKGILWSVWFQQTMEGCLGGFLRCNVKIVPFRLEGLTLLHQPALKTCLYCTRFFCLGGIYGESFVITYILQDFANLCLLLQPSF